MINKKNYEMMRSMGKDGKKLLATIFNAKNDSELVNRSLYVVLIVIISIIAARNGMFDAIEKEVTE